MGREVRILCDRCGKDIYGKEYYTLPITRFKNGRPTKFPTVWFCRECFAKLNITINDVEKREE